jgi:hypothetical protein
MLFIAKAIFAELLIAVLVIAKMYTSTGDKNYAERLIQSNPLFQLLSCS